MPNRAARRRVALLAGLASAWLLLSCAPALAHATLVEASPARGGEVPEPPDRVELRFTEPVGAEFDPVVVRDASGDRVDARDGRVDPNDARVVLAGLGELPEGSYTVEWRVTSIDGHVIDGRYGFAVVAAGEDRTSSDAADGEGTTEAAGAHGGGHRAGQEGGGAGEAASPDRRDPVAEPAAGRTAEISHGLALGATAFLAGLAPFAALVWLPATSQSGAGRAAIRPFGLAAWALLLALAVAGAGELSSYAVRASGEALTTELFWRTLTDSRVGAVWLARLGLALLLAATIAAARSGRTWLWW